MDNVKDFKIMGIDTTRPPRVRKEPYIDLVFKLSEKADKEWCQDFNALCTDVTYTVKVDMVEFLYIETWVKTMQEIPDHLKVLKIKVSECNQMYLDRVATRKQALLDGNSDIAGAEGPQGQLNEIISNLNFD